MTRVNTGQGKNIPTSIIVDELPTLYFHKIDRLIGTARSKETLEWLSSDIFGKVVQLKKGVTIDRDKTSINLNENMDSLVPASKISDMPTGWICG